MNNNSMSMRHKVGSRLGWTLVFSLGLSLFLPSIQALGLGFRIPNQDATAIGRGNAFIASADNASAIYYSPAAITRLDGHQVQAGFHNLAINSEFKPLHGGGSVETEPEIATVPQLYYVYSPKDFPVSFGVGLYAPYGLGLEWEDEAPFTTLAKEGRLLYATFNPVVAWQITPSLSIAAGPTLNYSTVELRQRIGLSPGDEFRFSGDGSAFGATAGLHWKPTDKWALAVTYHSHTTVDYDGDSRAKPYAPEEDTSAEMPFPQWVTAGLAFFPTRHWVLEAWVDWTDWDTLKVLKLEKASGDIPLAFNWESSFLTGVGATYKFDNGWFVSAGYFFSENSTSERDFNPVVPDTDLHVGSLGFGYRGKHWRFALSGQLITGPWRTVDESRAVSMAGESANGKYQWFNQSVNVSLGYAF